MHRIFSLVLHISIVIDINLDENNDQKNHINDFSIVFFNHKKIIFENKKFIQIKIFDWEFYINHSMQ